MKRQQRTELIEASRCNEDGQSIVLIAFVMVGIIAFVGLATDAGLLFARSSQWSAAVDAAALAGVVEMHIGVPEAEARAEQFLAANGWEFDANEANGTEVFNEFGIPEFAFTATVPVETFFLNLIGFDDIQLSHSATAAHYSLNEMPLLTQENRGQIREGSQFIFGANACTSDGDPVSPRLSAPGVGNSFREIGDARYQYRILIPDDYVANAGQTVRVQLFDPDPHNNLLAGDDVSRINTDSGAIETTFITCPLAPLDFSRSCTLATGDDAARNPVWLVRVDEVYRDDSCTGMKSGEPQSNTITQWRLYFVDDGGDEHTIASYTSNNAPFAATDLKWVTPGVTANVPTDNNDGTFDVNVLDPLGDGTAIPLDEFDNYSLYLDVSAPNGTSKNTWDVWAGPPAVANAFNVDVDGDGEINVNDRNLRLMQNFALGSTRGVRVYAVGRQPISPYGHDGGALSLPVSVVASADAGLDLYVSAFDIDGGAGGNLNFWFEVFGQPFAGYETDVPTMCDGVADCNNSWIRPLVTITAPINANPDDPDFAFHGGNLVVDYTAGTDEHVWTTLITRGTPFLTE